jgi:hypothetical protein
MITMVQVLLDQLVNPRSVGRLNAFALPHVGHAWMWQVPDSEWEIAGAAVKSTTGFGNSLKSVMIGASGTPVA